MVMMTKTQQIRHENIMLPEIDMSNTPRYIGCLIYLYIPVTTRWPVSFDSITIEKLFLRDIIAIILNAIPMIRTVNPDMIRDEYPPLEKYKLHRS
jgi:hypothetical protein